MGSSELSIEQELLRDAVTAEIKVTKTNANPTPGDDWHVVIEARVGDEEETDVEWAAFGLIFALGLLSFADARPRGMSENDYREDDEWSIADMLRHLRFEQGELHFHADYVRGRMLKTTVVMRGDGTLRVETVNREQVATRWISTLQGKKTLSVMEK
jgi:hypothetical protein